MLTLISHFYNEEFLLPYWLDYHRRVFDHGILVDYDSTDRSVEIIKSICPNWKIVKSVNKEFDCYKCDEEIIEIERSLSGWKMVLNTTEFVIHHDLKSYLERFRKEHPSFPGIETLGVWLVDSPQEYNRPLSSSPLIFQRTHGWFEGVQGKHYGPFDILPARHRLIHDQPDGQYRTGRHLTLMYPVLSTVEVFTLWAGWSPYPQVRNRKLQIQTRIPPRHIQGGMGVEHNLTAVGADTLFQKYSAQAGSLLENAAYAEELRRIKKHLYPTERLIGCDPDLAFDSV